MNLRKTKLRTLGLFITLSVLNIANSKAQSLNFTGFTKFEDEALTDVKVKAMVGSKVFAETTSGKNGFFSLKLDYNLNYSVYFEKENYVVMHADINGTVPEEKTVYKIKYEVTIPFYHVRNQTINQKTFEKPFTKIYFDGKSKFVDDTKYIEDFVVQLKNIPETKTITAPKIIPEKKHHIAGRVTCDNEAKTPFNLAKVVLLDTNSKEIANTVTNRFGVFSFSNIGIKSTSKIIVYPADNSLKCKVLIHNMNKEQVAFFDQMEKQNLQFLNNEESKLIEHLIDDTYIPFLAGKLMVEEKGENVLLSDKNVYLLSDKNEVIETTQTNIFGNFLFSKLPPDKNFIIAVNEAESGLNDNSHLHLYSYKDTEIDKKDTLQKGKFLFKFLSTEVKTYNELLIEDINIKMDLKGKMVGDNENNPLKDMKILLLDNNFKVVDSATTTSKGDFSFKYLPFSKNLVLRFADTTDMVNYSNIIIYDPNGKVIKYLSVKRGQRFDYKLLPGDLKLMQELYIDDPWLNLASKNPKKATTSNLVIIENIYFEFNQATLLPAAKQTLDKAILSMKNNPSMKIEISAHSDSKGSDDYNLKLSEKRAKSALEYIVSKGIEKNRVSAKGYGETKLLNKCGNNVECSEDEHAKNRRLEFNIILK